MVQFRVAFGSPQREEGKESGGATKHHGHPTSCHSSCQHTCLGALMLFSQLNPSRTPGDAPFLKEVEGDCS